MSDDSGNHSASLPSLAEAESLARRRGMNIPPIPTGVQVIPPEHRVPTPEEDISSPDSPLPADGLRFVFPEVIPLITSAPVEPALPAQDGAAGPLHGPNGVSIPPLGHAIPRPSCRLQEEPLDLSAGTGQQRPSSTTDNVPDARPRHAFGMPPYPPPPYPGRPNARQAPPAGHGAGRRAGSRSPPGRRPPSPPTPFMERVRRWATADGIVQFRRVYVNGEGMSIGRIQTDRDTTTGIILRSLGHVANQLQRP